MPSRFIMHTSTQKKDRRAACILCNGRCDPKAWLCHNCHRRVVQGWVQEIVDNEMVQSEPGEGTDLIVESTHKPESYT